MCTARSLTISRRIPRMRAPPHHSCPATTHAPCHHARPLWTEFLTQATQSITLSQTSFAGGKNTTVRKQATNQHNSRATPQWEDQSIRSEKTVRLKTRIVCDENPDSYPNKSCICPPNFNYYRPQCSCGKIMFSQASVILFTGGVWQTPPPDIPLGRHPRTDTPPTRDGHCSGRYASYWNTFLFYQ